MLYKRGALWWCKFKIGGQEFRRSTRVSSKREAAEAERAIRAEIKRELDAGRSGRMVRRPFREALLKWVKEGAPASMLTHAKNVRPYLDDVPLNQVVPKAHDMKAHMLERGLSPLTINRRLAVVRRVLNLAYTDWEWLQEPLAKKIRLFSEKGTSREVFLTPEEVERLAAAVYAINPEAFKVVMLAAYTGLRRGELLALKERNWNPPYLVLDSKTTKSGRPRAVPVVEQVRDLVTLPFNISKDRVSKVFAQARKVAGLPNVRLHDLRHTYASWLARNPDVPLSAIRDILGHHSLSVTSKYTHLRGDTYATIERVFQKQIG